MQQDLTSPAALQEALSSAWLAVRQQRWHDADRLFRPLMSTKVASASIWLIYAAVAGHLGDGPRAIARLRTAAALDPSDPRVVTDLARTLAGRRELRVADRWTRRAGFLRPHDPGLHLTRARALGLGPERIEAARPAARRAVLLDPGSAEATLILARVETALSPWREAVPHPDRLAVCSAGLPGAVDMLVHHCLQAGDGTAAGSWFARSRPGVEERLAAALIGPGDAVLDIGAHLGATALGFLRAGAGRVHAVEANPVMVRRLEAAMPPTVTIHPVALAEAEGEITLTMPTGRPGSASIDPSFNTGNVAMSPGGGTRITVRAVPLDALALERCRFWKIDVEGAEIQVLRGAAATLRHRPPDWLLAEVFGEPLRPAGHLDAFGNLLRDVLPYRYEVIESAGGDVRLRPLPAGASCTAPVDRGTPTPLYLFAAQPAPEAIP